MDSILVVRDSFLFLPLGRIKISGRIILIVSLGPIFLIPLTIGELTISPTTLIIREGENASFTCIYNGSAATSTVLWYNVKDTLKTSRLGNGSAFQSSSVFDNGRVFLLIVKPELWRTGRYQCQMGQIKAAANLIILKSLPSCWLQEARDNAPVVDGQIFKNKELSITCEIEVAIQVNVTAIWKNCDNYIIQNPNILRDNSMATFSSKILNILGTCDSEIFTDSMSEYCNCSVQYIFTLLNSEHTSIYEHSILDLLQEIKMTNSGSNITDSDLSPEKAERRSLVTATLRSPVITKTPGFTLPSPSDTKNNLNTVTDIISSRNSITSKHGSGEVFQKTDASATGQTQNKNNEEAEAVSKEQNGGWQNPPVNLLVLILLGVAASSITALVAITIACIRRAAKKRRRRMSDVYFNSNSSNIIKKATPEESFHECYVGFAPINGINQIDAVPQVSGRGECAAEESSSEHDYDEILERNSSNTSQQSNEIDT